MGNLFLFVKHQRPKLLCYQVYGLFPEGINLIEEAACLCERATLFHGADAVNGDIDGLFLCLVHFVTFLSLLLLLLTRSILRDTALTIVYNNILVNS